MDAAVLFSLDGRDPGNQCANRTGNGGGIAGNLRRHYPRWLLYSIVSLLCVANVINLAADLGRWETH